MAARTAMSYPCFCKSRAKGFRPAWQAAPYKTLLPQAIRGRMAPPHPSFLRDVGQGVPRLARHPSVLPLGLGGLNWQCLSATESYK